MVFFTCSHCGGSVKKPAVAKHYQTVCRKKTPFVTCVDCLKDFKGNEYEGHTKCFTEEEKYSAKGFVPKANANKGEKKQKAWSDCVQGLLSFGTLQDDEKKLLKTICKHENIPRKKAKFINFLKSTARIFADKTELIDRVWSKMDNYFKEANSASQNSDEQIKKRKHDEIAEENSENEKTKKKKQSKEESEVAEKTKNGAVGEGNKKKKKRSKEEKEEVNSEDQPKNKKAKKSNASVEVSKTNGKSDAKEEKSNNNDEEKAEKDDDDEEKTEDSAFDWTDAILKILTEIGLKNQVKVSKLQKKVLKKYGEVNGCEVDDKIVKKFSKKLNKIDSITVNGDYVSLKS